MGVRRFCTSISWVFRGGCTSGCKRLVRALGLCMKGCRIVVERSELVSKKVLKHILGHAARGEF